MLSLPALALMLSTASAGPKEGTIWDFVRVRRPERRAEAQAEDEGAGKGGDVAADTTDAPLSPPTVEQEDPEPTASEIERERRAEESFLEEKEEVERDTAIYEDPEAALVADPLHLDKIDPSEFDIPIVVNDEVVKWMEYFTGRGRKWFSVWLSRSTAYRPLMYEALDAGGLPRDLVFLSMIESGYSPNAYSKAAAVGLWQFISSTGKENGLRVDYWVDERRDPWASSAAATQFLQHLYAYYGDWYLAWAAYNAGPGRMNRAIERAGSKDFWVVAKNSTLRPETQNYVPKLIAAAIIGKHPERYGFTDIEYQPALEADAVVIEHAFDLEVLAEAAGISVEELEALNPHLRQTAIPDGGVTVRVPKATGETFAKNAAAVPASDRLRYQVHQVARGESLSIIAARYGTSVAAITQVNGISNPNRISVGTKLTIPKAGGTPVASIGKASSESATRKVTHTVQRGETLSQIAERYSVGLSSLKSWNSISNSHHIQVGQKLTVHTAAPVWKTHTVQRGDTLSAIATNYRCSVDDLRSWNELARTTIYPGQQLHIQGN